MNLREEMKRCLEHAKKLLLQGKPVHPVVMFYRLGHETKIFTLDMSLKGASRSHKLVQAGIHQRRPDSVIIVSDAWATTRLKSDLAPGEYKRGWVENQPDKTEALMVTGGSVETGVLSMILPYHRDNGVVVFEALDEFTSGTTAFFGDAWEIRKNEEIRQAQEELAKTRVH